VLGRRDSGLVSRQCRVPNGIEWVLKVEKQCSIDYKRVLLLGTLFYNPSASISDECLIGIMFPAALDLSLLSFESDSKTSQREVICPVVDIPKYPTIRSLEAPRLL